VIEPRRVALQAGHDLAQAGRARQLPVQQRDELALRRQPPHPTVRAMLGHQSVELAPRHLLQNFVENAILVPHGVVSFSCPERCQTLGTEMNQRHALVHEKLNRTAVGQARP
jgi:hypothetical protein